MSRFIPAWDGPTDQRIPARDLAGYRRKEEEGWDYYVTTSAWPRSRPEQSR
jgi:hypothetical protein